MTNKTINGVIERCALHLEWYGDPAAIDRANELRALLDAPDPIVEADGIGEPVGYCGLNALGGLRRNGGYLMMVEKPERYLDMPLYSADQVAALKSTITRLESEAFYAAAGFQAAREEIVQLRINLSNQNVLTEQANYHKAQRGQVIDDMVAEIAQLKAENERLQELLKSSK